MFNTKLICICITFCLIEELTAQRGFYSGARPQGYKDKPSSGATDGTIEDRFQASAPLAPLPINAHGDQGLIDRLNQLPRDKQPFWFLNYQQLEAQRGQAFPGQNAPQNNLQPVQNQAPAILNNGLDNRFAGSAPLINSPYLIVQGVPPAGNFAFP